MENEARVKVLSTFEKRSRSLSDAIENVAKSHPGLYFAIVIIDPKERRTRSYASPEFSEENIASLFEQVSEQWKLRIARKRS